VGNIDAATLRAVLLAHAEEIACVANTTSKHGVVLAVVHDDGRWLGARVVTAETVRPAEERETTEGTMCPRRAARPSKCGNSSKSPCQTWRSES
jgi:hypothetical protein